MAKRYLSKTRIVRGLQCHKSLYLSMHHPELEPEISDSQKAIFDQGTEVGIAAQSFFPNGVTIDSQPGNPQKACFETKAAMDSGALTIYEATFLFDDIQVKVDILNKDKKSGKWKIIEVKSSTSVHDVHLSDLAIQAWVAENSGLKISTYNLMYLNTACRFPKLKNLFQIDDVTSEILELKREIPKKIKEIKQILSLSTIPKIDIGPHCDDPYECSFKEHCWKEKKIPDLSVFDLPRIGKLGWEFYKNKTVKITDIDYSRLNNLQKRAVDCFKTKKRFVDSKGIKNGMSEWEFPLYYFDFETISYAIPKFNGTSPYSQIPFQFSCHIETADNKIKHKEFLHTEEDDPRPHLVKALVETIGLKGSIVAYNKGFESGVLEKLAKDFPKYAAKLRGMITRLVDPLPIVRAHVYDNAFKGSFSIKAVAPALIGKALSYHTLEVGDGTAAQRAFVQITSDNLNIAEKKRLVNAMYEYCKQDTFAMVELVRWMRSA